ncbi:triphosphate tunnel metalloenzyme 3 [Ziziphus jujuba]|uniref:Triphosphate tunnel metalloenzyme 3 n=1 Tax=Ziziphus jujuba TaxID=326968 RepID=A0ABM3I819_ZIZJJ|nr:triphosphate tunnel metalloenzyme 3 [Ziziphus jujuba]
MPLRVEEELRHACVAQPENLSSKECGILKRLKEEFWGFEVCGANVRDVYEWNDLKLEVDKILYEFGTNHEIECETSDLEGVKKVLEEFLKENGIQYSFTYGPQSLQFFYPRSFHSW